MAVPTGDFLAAVTEFDRALLAAMDRRLAELAESGAPSGARLDVGELRREHQDRAHWLPRALAHSPGTDWNAVRTGVHALLGRTV